MHKKNSVFPTAMTKILAMDVAPNENDLMTSSILHGNDIKCTFSPSIVLESLLISICFLAENSQDNPEALFSKITNILSDEELNYKISAQKIDIAMPLRSIENSKILFNAIPTICLESGMFTESFIAKFKCDFAHLLIRKFFFRAIAVFNGLVSGTAKRLFPKWINVAELEKLILCMSKIVESKRIMSVDLSTRLFVGNVLWGEQGTLLAIEREFALLRCAVSRAELGRVFGHL